MSINPRDYDLDKLRRMARERGGSAGDGEEAEPDIDLGSVGSPGGPETAGGSLRQGLYRELMPLSRDVQKPYLRSLPDAYAGEQLIFEWLEFLLMHAGYQGATGALSYYESIDWITADVESALTEYLVGLDETGADGTDLDVDGHLLSLVYVAKLAAMS